MHNFTKFLFKTAAAWTAWQERHLSKIARPVERVVDSGTTFAVDVVSIGTEEKRK
jgi:hypothetical protein